MPVQTGGVPGQCTRRPFSSYRVDGLRSCHSNAISTLLSPAAEAEAMGPTDLAREGANHGGGREGAPGQSVDRNNLVQKVARRDRRSEKW